jgi:hypothetical protein
VAGSDGILSVGTISGPINRYPCKPVDAFSMKNADRPFLLIICIAITLLYTIMAFIS